MSRAGTTPPGWRTARLGWLVLAGLLLLASPADARVAVLETHDGETYAGQLVVQTPTVVVLNVGGIEASFPRDEVVTLTIRDSPEEIYEKKRTELADDDLAGRFALAQLMYDQDALSLARRELISLQRQFPEVVRVNELLTVVEAKLRLEQTRSDRDARRAPDVVDRGDGLTGRRGPTDDHPYLTPQQINLIRVYEVDL
ncbi:MAG: hypothetical protein AAGL98_15370, partial [Planctomycetota bacterium]